MAQIGGGLSGILAVAALTGGRVAHPAVSYVVTVPGAWGVGGAFAAEVLISFGLMAVVLTVSNTARLARFTGLCAGALVATWIILEAPLSGMSMNPARSFASALPANLWTPSWIYLPPPPPGMLLAAPAPQRPAARGPGSAHGRPVGRGPHKARGGGRGSCPPAGPGTGVPGWDSPRGMRGAESCWRPGPHGGLGAREHAGRRSREVDPERGPEVRRQGGGKAS